jgi:hypothetical protein
MDKSNRLLDQKFKKNGLLFKNNFISTDISSFDPADIIQYNKRKNDFKKYYMNRPEFRRELLTRVPKIITKNEEDYHPNNLLTTNKITDVKTIGEETIPTQGDDDGRIVRTRRTLVNIDSRDRDQSIYPKPSSYTVYLNRKFINVKKMQIRTSEIPNSEQLIIATPESKQNNKILWKNSGNNTIFVATIPSGNYKPSDLELAFSTAMNKIKKDANNYHNFTVKLDIVSDICTFSQLESTLLSNPFSCTLGSPQIYVHHEGHGFISGDFVNISGVNSFGGINASLINKNQVIVALSVSEYLFEVTTPATLTVSDVGGNSCSFGRAQEFSLLFGEQGTPAGILGFELINTPYASVQQNTAVAQSIPIVEIRHFDAIYSTIVLEHTPEFSIKTGDKIYIINIVGTSSNPLINDPSGYVVSELTTNDHLVFGGAFPYYGPGDVFGRVFKIPAAIDPPTIGITGVIGLGTSGTLQTRTINRPIKLAGSNYILMKSPELANMANTGPVKNIACKVGLNSAPGTISFNTQVSGPTQFDTPLPELETISVEFVNDQDELIDFLDSDHSFTVEIQESIQEISNGVNFGSKLGNRDTT